MQAAGFALEQPLRDAAFACSASGNSKQLECNIEDVMWFGLLMIFGSGVLLRKWGELV
jgi:hypothetical protein